MEILYFYIFAVICHISNIFDVQPLVLYLGFDFKSELFLGID